MASFNELRRRSIIPLIGAGLAAYYLVVFLPLERRAAGMDEPLAKAWQKLAGSLELTRTNFIDFTHITNQLHETRQALIQVQATRQKAGALLEIPAALREQMSMPFQLVQYENARGQEVEDLLRAAKAAGVVIEPPVLSGFPEHTADVRRPELLWPALTMIDSLLRQAIHCRITTVHTLHCPVVLTNAPGPANGARWAEIPIDTEFSAPAAQALQLLYLLPLRPAEAVAAGHAAISTNKPPLFIDRLVLRRQAPEKPDQVRVLLRTVGFVRQDS